MYEVDIFAINTLKHRLVIKLHLQFRMKLCTSSYKAHWELSNDIKIIEIDRRERFLKQFNQDLSISEIEYSRSFFGEICTLILCLPGVSV